MKPDSATHSTAGTIVSDEDQAQLPPMALALLGRLGVDPADDEGPGVWVPTLAAAWAAGQSAVALANALRKELRQDGDEPRQWPVEQLQELRDTLVDIGDALPTMGQAVPALSDAIEAGEAYVDADTVRPIIKDLATRLESLGQRAVGAIIEAAFFAQQKSGDAHQKDKEELGRLFRHLETLFDKLLQLWLQPPDATDRDP